MQKRFPPKHVALEDSCFGPIEYHANLEIEYSPYRLNLVSVIVTCVINGCHATAGTRVRFVGGYIFPTILSALAYAVLDHWPIAS